MGKNNTVGQYSKATQGCSNNCP